MTNSGDIMMASSEVANPLFTTVMHPSKSKRLKVMLVQKESVERMHSFMICAYFPPPANTKFNPVMKMRALLVKLIKSEPSIVVLNLTNTTQLVLSQDKIPTNEQEFKKFFATTTDMHAAMNKQHIIISCKLLSEHTMNEIKFDKSKPQFLEWLDNEKVFIKAD